MHEKKRKRKLKEEEASGEANIRRPFDRDIDLKVGFLDSFFFHHDPYYLYKNL